MTNLEIPWNIVTHAKASEHPFEKESKEIENKTESSEIANKETGKESINQQANKEKPKRSLDSKYGRIIHVKVWLKSDKTKVFW